MDAVGQEHVAASVCRVEVVLNYAEAGTKLERQKKNKRALRSGRGSNKTCITIECLHQWCDIVVDKHRVLRSYELTGLKRIIELDAQEVLGRHRLLHLPLFGRYGMGFQLGGSEKQLMHERYKWSIARALVARAKDCVPLLLELHEGGRGLVVGG